MFSMEKLAACPLFTDCLFYTPFYEKTVEDITIWSEWEEEPGSDNLYLVSSTSHMSPVGGLPSLLDRLHTVRAVGLILWQTPADQDLLDHLIRECRKRLLVFGVLSAPRTMSGLIRSFHTLIPSPTNEDICSYEVVLHRFHTSFCTSGVNGLLQELSFWTGSQVALVIGQDTFVYPRTPVLDPAVFNPACWHKLAAPSAFSEIRQYRLTTTSQSILQMELFKNHLPFGQMLLIGKEDTRYEADCFLLNYASVLCTGLDELNRSSEQIGTALSMLCQGRQPDDRLLNLLPEHGCAMILQAYACVLSDTSRIFSPAGTDCLQDYLSYLIHHHFPQRICYCFCESGIRLFVEVDDEESFLGRLIRILEHAGMKYHVGVSRRYERNQAVTAFSEAVHASKMAELLDYEQRPCFFHELGIYRLFSYPENEWPINQMLGEMDDLLQTMDKDKRDTLSLTIRVFVECNFNYQKTAERLYTHVNTIRYRIHLIEELWNADLSSEEGRLLFGVLAKLLPLWVKHTRQELTDMPQKNT